MPNMYTSGAGKTPAPKRKINLYASFDGGPKVLVATVYEEDYEDYDELQGRVDSGEIWADAEEGANELLNYSMEEVVA